jgi:NADP-dependent 3-hydroxy acid dehydrogenase YdfG
MLRFDHQVSCDDNFSHGCLLFGRVSISVVTGVRHRFHRGCGIQSHDPTTTPGGFAVTATKSIFITGAGSGMGRAGAEHFHARGWRVGATDRNADGLTSLAEELGPDRIWTRQVDVTDKSALDAALADFCGGNAGGGLDMMWNNAGIGESGWFEDVPYEAAMRVVDVNFKAVLTGAYGSLPYLRKSTGSLMFSTSSSATYGMPQIAAYSATKHAVKGLIPTSSADVAAIAPKKGMFRLMPASSVAEAAWAAYHDQKRLHWYVPASIGWIDRMKGISAEFVRGRIVKALPGLAD